MFICRLPSNPALRKAWMDVIPEESRPISESSRICSKHFLESDFVYYKGGKRLVNGSIPSIFCGTNIQVIYPMSL